MTEHGFSASGPELTFPSDVAQLVRAHYDAATTILEYGSGGSTAMAAQMTGKTVFSVENAAPWHASMQAWFDENPPVSTVHLHLEKVGKTKDWGWPVNETRWRRYPLYPLSVWQRNDFQHPDLVLIDGRFRVGCFLATLLSITKPVTVLFDDYIGREDKYNLCESFAQITQTTGRMVKFDLTPTVLDPKRLLDVVTAFGKIN
ncbi:hypothetical protein EDD53_0550 [Pacificibacter maritimus]|uniref:Methyltransferase family protein n=1 Tax=Pacificibacter maritimus TaxID=762213 RepID=A0A3N4ULF2_9RHOB|nr:hypothetical protein [Pacificibacter maritimus]RPE71432.1 hypothetical protein EDD53_0550 [Pacificibacter maritimus]